MNISLYQFELQEAIALYLKKRAQHCPRHR